MRKVTYVCDICFEESLDIISVVRAGGIIESSLEGADTHVCENCVRYLMDLLENKP
jgi:hypothetical protein